MVYKAEDTRLGRLVAIKVLPEEMAFQCHYERTASPFKWLFTRADLHKLLAKIDAKRLARAA